MERPTPRVNSAMLNQYNGKAVRLIGKVLELQGESVLLEASDLGQVLVKLNRDSNITGPFVEVIGKVGGEGQLTEFTSVNIDKVDMELVESIVQLSHAHPEIFPVDDDN